MAFNIIVCIFCHQKSYILSAKVDKVEAITLKLNIILSKYKYQLQGYMRFACTEMIF